jgi:hypothetical protein
MSEDGVARRERLREAAEARVMRNAAQARQLRRLAARAGLALRLDPARPWGKDRQDGGLSIVDVKRNVVLAADLDLKAVKVFLRTYLTPRERAARES